MTLRDVAYTVCGELGETPSQAELQQELLAECFAEQPEIFEAFCEQVKAYEIMVDEE